MKTSKKTTKQMAKQIFTTEKGVVDKENNKLLGVIGSTGVIDRHGESVNPMGWQIDNYQKNPVILYGHDYSTLPVGKAERVYVEDNSLKFDIKFADTSFAKDVFNLFADKILNAFSVGFIPKKFGVSGQDAYDIMEQELLELSVVTVPANPEALSLIKSIEVKYKDELNEEPKDEPKKDEEVIEDKPTEDKPVEETPVEEKPVDETVEEKPEIISSEETETPKKDEETSEKPEGEVETEVPTEPKVIPEGEATRETTSEATNDKVDEATLKLLKEIANSFKKADNEVGNGLHLLKSLKSALFK